MRATSNRVRQLILVKDEPIDPLDVLEHVQLLNEDGTIVDPTKDQTKMSWRRAWQDGMEYTLNDVVAHDNKGWVYVGLTPGVMLEPGAPAGTNVGAPIRDIQARSTDKADDGVLYRLYFDEDTPLDSGGFPAIPVVLDFTDGLMHDPVLHMVNHTSSHSFICYVNGSGGAANGVIVPNIGNERNDRINFTTFWGGSNPGMLLFSCTDGPGVTGYLEIRLTEAELDPPDEENPWEEFVVADPGPEGPAGADGTPGADGADGADGAPGVGVPVGGSTGQVLAKNSATNYDTGWITPAAGGSSLAIVSSLPGSPSDGDMVAFQNAAMATQGVVWILRYRSGASGTKKWEFLGGSPLYLYEAAQSNTSSLSMQNGGSSTLTVPLLGDYEVQLTAALAADNTTAANGVSFGIGVNGAVTSDNEGRRFNTSAPAYNLTQHALGNRVIALASADVIRPMFQAVNSGLVYIEKMKMSLRPVRVG